MDFRDVARTTFACREFTEDPVDDATLYRILETARFAPSGGNRQGWRVIVVKDPDARAELARLCQRAWNVYIAQRRLGENPWNSVDPTAVDVAAAETQHAPATLLDDLVAAPAVVVVGVDLRVVASFDKDLDRVGVISGASVYPFVWNLLLAARNEGLGGTLTTFLAGREAEAQKLLGLPDHVAVAAMVPLGQPKRQLTKLTRSPVEDWAFVGRFDGPPLTAG